jgi:hypothetical protein
VLLLLAMSLLTPHPAAAAIRVCRSDPIILLSNGETIQTAATIATDAANVRPVKYTLHLPKGVKVIVVLFTPNQLGRKELVSFIDDRAPYSYATDTVITTSSPNVSSTAYTRVLRRAGSISGMSGEHLIIRCLRCYS